MKARGEAVIDTTMNGLRYICRKIADDGDPTLCELEELVELAQRRIDGFGPEETDDRAEAAERNVGT